MRTVGDVAKIFGVDQQIVKTWAYKFREYLSPTANPAKGVTRSFSQHDLMVLALIAQYWEDEPDYASICTMLNSEDHYNDQYIRIAFLNWPLFQDIPDNLDEPACDTVFLGGMRQAHCELSLEIAEAYKNAGDELVRIALAADAAYEFLYPVFFMYRHAIEVYLKILVPEKNNSHNFSRLTNAFRAKHKTEFAQWAKDRLDEFHMIDPIADTFRYADSRTPLPLNEFTLSIRQLRVVVDHICVGLKNKILDSSIPPAYLS